jgi:hypothetical protein
VTITAVTHLSGSDKVVTLWLVVALVLLAGGVVIAGRRWLEGGADGGSRGTTTTAKSRHADVTSHDTTLIRSWLAISLVGGLLIFVATSFCLDDTTLRSTVIGGVVANAGAAVAFYFASKASDQAR